MRVLASAAAVARAAAGELRRRARLAVAERGRCAVALSGGRSPRLLFRELASAAPGEIPWHQVHLFWSDERTVPPDHPDSNYRMAHEELLSRVDVPAANVHRLRGEDPDPARAAANYEADLRRFFDLKEGQLPRFDLVFLGMGADGHTASLFPGSEVLTQQEHLVASPWVDTLKSRRLTLTARAINHASCVVFLVAGEEKAAALRWVLEGPHRPLELPSQGIEPSDGELLWLVDTAAARLLSPRPRQQQ